MSICPAASDGSPDGDAARGAAHARPQATRAFVVVGTAGHVDHGKTALVRALTGMDADRLPEERARGLSIELGFAHLQWPDGRRLAFVDVPGHERFVRTMVAGVHGLDACLLVVAADEGVMPQTREHVDILRLLGVDRGVVVVSKIDLVDDDRLARATAEVRAALAGSGFEQAPLVQVSSRTGAGLAALRTQLAGLFATAPLRPGSGPVRLPLDRSFAMPGFGTVVTGTLVSGTVRVGDRLALVPGRTIVRIRGLQMYGSPADQAAAGNRVAANLAGVDWRDVHRGQTLATPGTLSAHRLLVGRVRLLGGPSATVPSGVADGARLRLHVGTQDAVARLVWLGDVPPAGPPPGVPAWARLHATEPLATRVGDLVLLRRLSPAATVGAFQVLASDRLFRKHRGRDLEELASIESGGRHRQIAQALAQSPQTATQVAAALGCATADLAAEVARAQERGEMVALADGDLLWLRDAWDAARRKTADRTAAYLAQHPLAAGWPREAARRALWPDLPPVLGRRLLEDAAAAGAVRLADRVLRPADGAAAPPAETLAAVERVRAALEAGGLQPPAVAVLADLLGRAAGTNLADVLHHLVERGEVVHTPGDLYFDAQAVAMAEARVRAHFAQEDSLTLGQLRDLLNTTRKFALALAEHFDRISLTRREGNRRRPANL